MEQGDVIFIGRIRRDWFIPCTSEWNGLVRDVSASLEEQGGIVSQAAFHAEMLKRLKDLEFAKGFAQAMSTPPSEGTGSPK